MGTWRHWVAAEELVFRFGTASRRFDIGILVFLELLEQTEAQSIESFMAHRQVWEDEVSCWVRAIEICHTSHRRSCQDGEGRRCYRQPALGDRASILQCRKEEEVGIVGEGDVGSVVALTLEDLELYHGRRVHWATIRRSLDEVSHCRVGREKGQEGTVHTFCPRSTCSGPLRLLNDFDFCAMSVGRAVRERRKRGITVCKLPAVFRDPVHGGIRLVLDWQDGRSHRGAHPGTLANPWRDSDFWASQRLQSQWARRWTTCEAVLYGRGG